MQKVVLLMLLIFIFFATFISMHSFYEHQQEKRACEDEIRKAAAVLIVSVEENIHNHDVIKTGDRDVLPDYEIMLGEFNWFLSNSAYIDRKDVKIAILMFGGVISYFNCNDEEIYTEAVFDINDGVELEKRIKRQLRLIFHEDDFAVSPRIFDDLGNRQIILIYERPYKIIGRFGGADSTYSFSKLTMK